jgi:hypothetical protein
MPSRPENPTDWTKALLVAQIFNLQASGHVPARTDGKPLEVVLVESGLSQTEVGALVGRSQQAISLAVAKFRPTGVE